MTYCVVSKRKFLINWENRKKNSVLDSLVSSVNHTVTDIIAAVKEGKSVIYEED
jgi:hypothetical protein